MNGGLPRSRPDRPAPLAQAGDGHVFIEFLFIVLPLLTFFLGTLQLALLSSAKLATQQAARTGARAAAVILDDHPDLYGGEARGAAPPGSARYQQIQLAAATPLLAAMPAIAVSDHGAITEDIFTPTSQLASAMEMTIAEHGDEVEVEVVFEAPCRIPIGRLVVCGGDATRRMTGVSMARRHRVTY